MKGEKLEIKADGLLLKNAKIILNGKDITDSILNINIHMGINHVNTATIELFIGDMAVNTEVING